MKSGRSTFAFEVKLAPVGFVLCCQSCINTIVCANHNICLNIYSSSSSHTLVGTLGALSVGVCVLLCLLFIKYTKRVGPLVQGRVCVPRG
jgi:hypothetical protein